jgi:hypothetical protein
MTVLDELVPRHDFSERHSRLIEAPPEEIWDAIHDVTLGEMPAVRLLFALRFMPSRAREPMLDQMLGAGFARLDVHPGREIVFGVAAQMWKPNGEVAEIRDGAEFDAFDRPGFAKAAMNFRLVSEGERTRLETETRVVTTDPAARRGFRRYWFFIRLGSGLIRRLWLLAIARRAMGERSR